MSEPRPGAAHPLLDPAARPIIAHRGASAHAPENTLEALGLAVAQGADAIEVDVRLSADGVPVLMHDPTLDRTLGRPGEVARLTADALSAAGVPTLEAALAECPGTPFLLEIKAPEAQHAVAELLRRRGEIGRCAVASFRHRALDAFRRGGYLVGASRLEIAGLVVRTRLGLPGPAPGGRFLAVPNRWKNRIEVPRRRFVAAARRHGLPVHVWTVNDPERARDLWRRGVCGIITDLPALLREARDSGG